MTDADLNDILTAYRIDGAAGDLPALVAEVRRLRAEHLAYIEGAIGERDVLLAKIQEYAHINGAVDVALADARASMFERHIAELRACLEIAMDWCPDEGGFPTARDFERCRRAVEASR
jgi:hypothetical protein